ncbi:MAG: CARDB domain-containing protein [Candidatus Pacearchaeota archaeon]
MNKTLKIIMAVLILGLYVISMIAMASALTISDVTINPDEIEPGKTSKISLTLENEGDNDLTDVSVNLILDSTQLGTQTGITQFSLPFAPVSSSEYGIDEIKEGDDETAKFEISALSNAASGTYKIPVVISYREEDVVKTKSSLISLSINSKPILGISSDTGLLLKGQENPINIKVTNKGLADVKFLEIDLGTSTYYSIIGSGSSYIGDVDSDDFDSAEFSILFKETAPSLISMPVTIKYRDALNNQYTENTNLQLRVYTNEEAIQAGLIKKSNTFLYIGVVLVLIVIYLIYRRIKKRRNNKFK